MTLKTKWALYKIVRREETMRHQEGKKLLLKIYDTRKEALREYRSLQKGSTNTFRVESISV